MPRLKIGQRWVGDGEPTYFIVDIGANHDGDLERAKMLIDLSAEAGADAAKFQSFRAPKIVSKYGFEALGDQLSHQATWKKSVYDVYRDASLDWEWTGALKAHCDQAGLEFFSAPYDFQAIDMLDPYVNVYKIGSGDISWPEMLSKVASKGKPVILSTGASDIGDVQRAVDVIGGTNEQIVLLQCNTNYTGSVDNFKHSHLNVLKTYRLMYPDLVLGLSDHSPGHAAVLGAVALGASVVEKHFTDDNSRDGADHPFSMTPRTWREMVDRTRELEEALGSADKRVVGNEQETVILQRRCLRASRDLGAGTLLARADIDVLRPAPLDAIFPYDIQRAVGLRLSVDAPKGEYFRWSMLGQAE